MEQMLDSKSVAEVLGVNVAQVRKLARLGQLRSYRLGYRTLRFKSLDVEQYIQSRGGNSTDDPQEEQKSK